MSASRIGSLLVAAAVGLAACGTAPSRVTPPLATGAAPIALPPTTLPAAPVLHDDRGRLSLRHLLRHAAAHSPRLHRARAAAAAARYRRPQVTALPDPMLRLGWYAEEVQTRTGPQEFAVGVSQTIPWPKKLSAAGDAADLRADQARVREWIAARDVLLEVTRRYHELDYLTRAGEATAELETLWADLAGRAAGAPRVSAAEIARAETRREQSRYDRLVLRELAEVERARLRALLDLPDSAAVGDPVPTMLPRLVTELEPLRSAALRSNQELLVATLAIKEAAAREDLAKLSKMPDFTVGGRYLATGRRPDGVNPAGNGADPVMIELGITLPVQRSAKNAAIAEARQRVREMAFARKEVSQKLRADLAEAFYRARNEARLLKLHERVLVPQAEHAAREAEARAGRGESGLAGLIETIAARHQVRLGALRARADYAIRLTRIEQLIGTPLARVDARPAKEAP